MNYLSLIGRSRSLLQADLEANKDEIFNLVSNASFLVVGAAGSIGQAVCKEIFKRNPKVLHAIDISENNMVELVRDLRSTVGYIDGDFQTFALDCGSNEFDAMINTHGPYDYILNLSALKHVRSEKDPYTLMRLIDVNILNSIKLSKIAVSMGSKKYFCVSTDKAANPVNMMGASKRIMEMFLMRESEHIKISMARFANVAFSDGSLLHGFNQRFLKKQPITAPHDVRRYFVTPEESGQLCLLSVLLGKNREILFPKLSAELNLTTFSDIAVRYLDQLGYSILNCSSEHEARLSAKKGISERVWPCYFFKSDTTGEKDFEEFYTENEVIDMSSFVNMGIVKNELNYDTSNLDGFLAEISDMKLSGNWNKSDLLLSFKKLLPDFHHTELGKNLDQRM